MNEKIHNLLALRCLRQFIHFIKHHHGAHGFGGDERVHNLTAMGGFIDHLVTGIGARIGIASEGNKLKGPSHRTRNSIFNDGGLSDTWWTHKEQGQTLTGWVRNLGTNELHNLKLGVLLAIGRTVQAGTSASHKFTTSFRTILEPHRDVFVDTQWKIGYLFQPRAQFVVLIRSGIHILETMVLGKNHTLHLGGDTKGQYL